MGSIPGLGIYSGGGNDNLLQDSCLENPVDRGAWWTTVHSCEELDRIEWLSTHTHTHTHSDKCAQVFRSKDHSASIFNIKDKNDK